MGFREELPGKIHRICLLQYLGYIKKLFVVYLMFKSECSEFLSAKYANPNLERG